MGDVGDDYRAFKEMRRQKRWENYERARELLYVNKDIITSLVEKPNGHFIINDEYDFWATTGLFIQRKTRKRGRGINNLLAAIRGSQANDNQQS